MTSPKIVYSSNPTEEEVKILKEYEEASRKGTSYGDEIRAQKRRDDALKNLKKG